MKTLDLKEAAFFLKMTPEGVRSKAARGEIPGAKPGKRWCFREDDLAEYLRSIYAYNAKTSQGVQSYKEDKKWHSVKEEVYGGSESVMVEKEYKSALGQKTK